MAGVGKWTIEFPKKSFAGDRCFRGAHGFCGRGLREASAPRIVQHRLDLMDDWVMAKSMS